MADLPVSPNNLASTLIPATLLRKSQTKFNNSIASKYQFQKTTGNAFIAIQPPQIKFSGYQLDKSYTASVKIVNRAPIPQRIFIIPPQNSIFVLKSNKKGSIASGMSQIITIVFKSNEYKYQTDVISIRTETQNFVVPIYAYPTLPNLRSIFPKLIDYGNVQVNQTMTYSYPIKNSVPLNFQFQFIYTKQCQQIIINPLKGIIQANQTFVVQISFLPKLKHTYKAQLFLKIIQFDFQPLPISIIGTGTQKLPQSLSKRIKSSRLTPLQQTQQPKKTNQPIKRRPSADLSKNIPVQNTSNIIRNPTLNETGMLNLNSTMNGNNLRKVTMRASIAKLTNTKKPVEQQKVLNPGKLAQRQYLNRFSRIQQLDKQKQIKFQVFLGDKQMTQEQRQTEKDIVRQIQLIRKRAFERGCVQRYNPQITNNCEIEFKIIQKKQSSWDDKQNDELHNRKLALQRFMKAGSKVILKYRLLKRLSKIKILLNECKNKQQVKKLVQQSHSKALDQQQGLRFDGQLIMQFGMQSLIPNYFQLQFDQQTSNKGDIVFKPQGKTMFDDFKQIKVLLPHNTQKLKFTQTTFPPDYIYHTKLIKSPRSSAQQQYHFKSSTISSFKPPSLSTVHNLPLKVPLHFFIYDDNSSRRYKNYLSCDQKDPEIYLKSDNPIQDEFEGWTKGQFQILKYKFSRNVGFDYYGVNGFNNKIQSNKLPLCKYLRQDIPRHIQNPNYQDTIEDGDSDEQKLLQAKIQPISKFLQQIQGKNNELKNRRQKKQIINPNKQVINKIQSSLNGMKQKAVGQFIGLVKEANKWAQNSQNRILF